MTMVLMRERLAIGAGVITLCRPLMYKNHSRSSVPQHTDSLAMHA